MLGRHAYSLTNALSGLAASAFTWNPASTTNRPFLNDGRMDRRMIVSASAASGITLVINFGTPTALMGLAVLNCNAAVQKTDAALRIRAATDAAITAGVVTAKAASTLYSTTLPRNKDHVLQFASVSKQYWELTWTWTGTVTNFAIGELWAYAAAATLTRRAVWGSGPGKKMFTASDQFQTGERRGIKQGGPQRVESLLFSDLSTSESAELDNMWSGAEADIKPFLWIDSYEAVATAAATTEQNCVFGRLSESDLSFSEDDVALFNTRGLTVRSAGREAGA